MPGSSSPPRPERRQRRQGAPSISPPCEKTNKNCGQQDGNDAVGNANRFVPQRTIPCQEVVDGGRNDFDARQQSIEGRGKKVAAAADGRAENNDSVSDIVGRYVAGEH